MTQKRDIQISVYKYFASLMIMACHFYRLGLGGGYPLYGAYIYVEFFFMLTGYYTTKHFDARSSEADSLDEAMHRALVYTKLKFVRYIPFVLAAVSAEYMLEMFFSLQQGSAAVINSFVGFPMEVFMLTSIFPYSKQYPKLAPIWYLSAAFIIFPIFCFFIQQKQKQILLYIEALLPLLYYGYFGLYGIRDYPHDLLRAACGMLLGGLVYHLSGYLHKCSFLKKNRLFRGIEIICFLIPLLFAYRNDSFGCLILFCFLANLCVHFSGIGGTVSASVLSKLACALDRQSLLIFLNHWVVATYIGFYQMERSVGSRILYYYVSVVLLSVAEDFAAKQLKTMICIRNGDGK